MNSSLEYLVSEPDGIFDELMGDGSESGFEIHLTYDTVNGDEPFVAIPSVDNTCEAAMSDIRRTVRDEYGKKYCEIFITTEVVSDTGGCLVWVKRSDNKTLAVVAYKYAIN